MNFDLLSQKNTTANSTSFSSGLSSVRNSLQTIDLLFQQTHEWSQRALCVSRQLQKSKQSLLSWFQGVERCFLNEDMAVGLLAPHHKNHGSSSEVSGLPLSPSMQTVAPSSCSSVSSLSFDPKGILDSGQVHPVLAQKMKAFLQEAQCQGLNVFVFEGYRSLARQNQLLKSGRNVTGVGAGNSYHNYGLAIDVVFYNNKGQPSWSQSHDWQALGRLGKKHGLVWGGDWRRRDYSHFEYHPQLNIRQIKKIYHQQGLEAVWRKVTSHAATGSSF